MPAEFILISMEITGWFYPNHQISKSNAIHQVLKNRDFKK